MKEFSLLYAIAGALFVVIDGIWLSFIANNLYRDKLGKLLLDKPLLAPAALFYLIYIFALIVFVIKPGVDQSLATVAWKGALLGFTMYATYDLTNKATLNGWSTSITIIDLIWGACITATVSVLTVLVYTRLFS
jgi:uncharacterized membrane protein